MSKVKELIALLNSPQATKSFSTVLQYLREFTDHELVEFAAKDESQNSTGNVTNELVRGVVLDIVKQRGLTEEVKNYEATNADKKYLTADKKEFEIEIVTSDKTTRGREPISFSDSELKNEYGIDPLLGSYVRRTAKGQKDALLPAKICGVCFTDRIGLPMFLSSFKVKLNPADVKKYGVRDTIIPISENSFVTDERTWKNIFDLIGKITSVKYSKEQLCFRSFFVDAFEQGQVIEALRASREYSKLLDIIKPVTVEEQIEAELNAVTKEPKSESRKFQK